MSDGVSRLSVVVGIDVAKAHVDVSVLGAKLDAQRMSEPIDLSQVAFAAEPG